jgi:light-independent protochlorophyllide reductase subunit B
MFREDFEFHDGAGASHLGHGSAPKAATVAAMPSPAEPHVEPALAVATGPLAWSPDAEAELRKIPFFVRGKARRNTEKYASEQGLATISLETLYDAKAHFGR